QHAGARIVQDVGELLRSEANVQRQKDRAAFDDAIVGFQQAVTIGAQKGHAIARLNSGLSQSASKPRNTLGKLSIGKPLFSTDDGGPLWILLRGVAKKANCCQGNVHRSMPSC